MSFGMKILAYDIEASSLKADYGFIFCISYKWIGEGKIHTISIRNSPTFKTDCTNDKWVVEQFAKVFAEADAQLAHFGMFFDYPFLNTRLLTHGLAPLPPVQLIDTWKTAKKKLRLSSNRLDSIFSAMGIETKKTRLKPTEWVRAAAGHVKAIKYIEDHCYWDVDALEKVYLKLRPLMLDLPNHAVTAESNSACPRCGVDALIKRGFHITKAGRKPRYQCTKCRGWSHGKVKKETVLAN